MEEQLHGIQLSYFLAEKRKGGIDGTLNNTKSFTTTELGRWEGVGCYETVRVAKCSFVRNAQIAQRDDSGNLAPNSVPPL